MFFNMSFSKSNVYFASLLLSYKLPTIVQMLYPNVVHRHRNNLLEQKQNLQLLPHYLKVGKLYIYMIFIIEIFLLVFDMHSKLLACKCVEIRY